MLTIYVAIIRQLMAVYLLLLAEVHLWSTSSSQFLILRNIGSSVVILRLYRSWDRTTSCAVDGTAAGSTAADNIAAGSTAANSTVADCAAADRTAA